MLRRLLIQDYILIERVELDLGQGFCTFTGETGAGKSMVLGALAVLVGEKFPAEPVRPGAKKAIIEGEFDFPEKSDIAELFSKYDIEASESAVLLRREIASGGRARCFVNDGPVALDVLRAVGEHFVDLHGQHEQQALLKRARHLDFFDAFAGTFTLRSDVGHLYREHARLQANLEKLREVQQERRQNEGLLRFQLAEVERLNPREGEEEELEREIKRLEGAEKLAQATRAAWEALSDGDIAAEGLLRQARGAIETAREIDSDFDTLAREIAEAEAHIKELGNLARDQHLKVTYDPERLEKSRERLHELSSLKRKYSLKISELIQRAEQWREALSDADSIEDKLAQAEKDTTAAATTLAEKAAELSKKRLAKKETFEREVRKHLGELGLATASFEVSSEALENGIGVKGSDRIEFLFSANPGQKLRPLVEVASGGEASRIMLALKRAFADKLEPMTLVFDEIDIGISGRMAEKVGNALLNLARRHQVLAITHLPQIASRAQRHFSILKRSRGEETLTEVRPLEREERVQELALLLGGAKVTPKVVATAEELLKRGQAVR